MIRRRRVAWALACMVFGACGGSSPSGPAGTPPGAGSGPAPPRLVRMAVGLDPQSTEVGRVAQATAAGVDQYDQPIATGPVAWTSALPTVATINAAGTLAAIAPGTTLISASAGAVTASATFTVMTVSTPPVVLRVLPGTARLTIGESLQLTAVLVMSGRDTTTAPGVLWSSSAPTVAGVSSAGVTRAAQPGMSVIAASSGAYAGSTVIEVVAQRDTSIHLRRASPLNGATVGDTLSVICTTNLTRRLVRVVAAIDLAETVLDTVHLGPMGAVPGWGKQISLTTVPIGIHRLVITAFSTDGKIDVDSTWIDRQVPQSGGQLPGGGRKQVRPAAPPALTPIVPPTHRSQHPGGS